MYSKVKFADHPIHPMLVSFPITFYVLTVVAFIVYQGVNSDIFWYRLGYFSNFAAIICAVVAAVPGFIDWAFGIPKNTSAQRTGLVHMILNLCTLALYAVSAYLLKGTWDTASAPMSGVIFLTSIGAIILLGAGYLGWNLISRDKVGVDMTPVEEQRQEKYERSGEQPPMFH